MPEAQLMPACKVLIEETRIYAKSGIAYPRLIIPIKFTLKTLRDQKHYVLLNAQFALFMQNTANKISDAINIFVAHKVEYTDDSFNCDAEFPLDLYRISQIEEIRRDNVNFKCGLILSIGIYEPLAIQKENKEEIKEFITDIKNINSEINLTIPKSFWVERILPSFGFSTKKLIEIPLNYSVISDELKSSIDELSTANKYFNLGDYDKAVAHCRNAIEPLKQKIPELKNFIKSETEYSWVKEIGEATFEWLEKIFKKTRDLTSKPHHLPSIGHFARYDAEAIMLVVTALLSYVSRLTPEQNE